MSLVEFEAGPGRLDAVVAERLGASRADAQRAIALGRVLVDGRLRQKSFRLSGGERVSADVSAAEKPGPEPGGVPVLYEDEDLLVVSKPAGLVTHGTTSRRGGTLVNRLLGMGLPLAAAGGDDRPGIVHRLDAGTSGLLVVAKTDRAHETLSALFREHRVDRRYLALVRGLPEHDRFLVEAPLARDRSRIRVRTATGRKAATEVEVRRRYDGAALVEATPRTGRTHQVRVHLAAVGHPVLGDRAYGGGGDDAARLGLSRPFLHSWRIAFDHPITGARIELEDPLPGDLEQALERLGTLPDPTGPGDLAAGPPSRRVGA
jgi:23S rRNA pseudouridine1911/1915/1917 synthase